MESSAVTRPAKPLPNSRFADPTPNQLRLIVFDYLRHHGYTATALALALDSAIMHVDADGDEIMSAHESHLTAEMLEQVELRSQIRLQILNGQVEAAIDLLGAHFPSVLSETSVEEKPQETPRSQGEVVYVAATSVEPVHLNLNLRVLSFIEAVRTVPLPRVGSLPSSPLPSHILHADDPEVMDKHKADLITRAQKLYASTQMLQKPSERATYLEEVKAVGGLLAHKVPEDSPLALYLSQERREAVAKQIDNAILYRTGNPLIPHVELYARYTSVIWEFLSGLGVKASSISSRPPWTRLFVSDLQKPDKKDTGDKADSEIVPPFEFRKLLDMKT